MSEEEAGATGANLDPTVQAAVDRLIQERPGPKPTFEDQPKEGRDPKEPPTAEVEPETEPEPAKKPKVETKPKEAKPDEPDPWEGVDPTKRNSWEGIREREKQIFARREEMKREEERLRELSQQVEQSRRQIDEMVAFARKEPTRFLETLGIRHDDLIQRGLNEGNPGPEEHARRRDEALESRLKSLEEAFQNGLQNIIPQVLGHVKAAQYHEQFGDLLADPKYELILAESDDPVEYMKAYTAKHHEKTENMLTPRQACERKLDELKEVWQRRKSNKSLMDLLAGDQGSTQSDKRPPKATQAKHRSMTNLPAARPARPSPDHIGNAQEEIEAAAQLVGPDAWT